MEKIIELRNPLPSKEIYNHYDWSPGNNWCVFFQMNKLNIEPGRYFFSPKSKFIIALFIAFLFTYEQYFLTIFSPII